MREAFKEAEKAYRVGEVPVGAVLVYKEKIVSKGHNQVEMLQDATAHAEMRCMGEGAKGFANWRLLDTTLYCTMEPCAMCAAAMFLSRIKRLVWGAPDYRLGANGSWMDLFAHPHPTHRIEVTSDVLASDCGTILQRFFRERRKEVSYQSK